jgi:hypothetical protein
MMYARLAAGAATPLEKLATEPGFYTGYLLEQVGIGRPVLLSLWDDEGDFEVIDDWAGKAAGAAPVAAKVLYFDGPVSPVAFDAGQRAARDRLQPALAAVPGLIRQITLWQPADRSIVVVSLGESMAALEAAGRAVNATELLPDEDPALLPGPDRGEAYRVLEVAV